MTTKRKGAESVSSAARVVLEHAKPSFAVIYVKTLSLHKTEKGASKALRKVKLGEDDLVMVVDVSQCQR